MSSMATLRKILSEFGEFMLLEIDSKGNIFQKKYNNTKYTLSNTSNLKEIFGNREQKQLVHDIQNQKTTDSILRTSSNFGKQTVKINTSKIQKGKRYILINFAKTFGEKDMSQRKYIESLIQESERDPMTKTFNRRGAWRKIDELLNQKTTQYIGIIFVDIDGLKKINDEKGHAQGDKAILQISRLLKNSVRKADVVMRYGGDEFVVIVEEKSSQRSASRGITRRILKTIQEGRFATTVSMGVHLIKVKAFIKGINSEKELEKKWDAELRKADNAVYKSKENGKATYRTTVEFDKFFDS